MFPRDQPSSSARPLRPARGPAPLRARGRPSALISWRRRRPGPGAASCPQSRLWGGPEGRPRCLGRKRREGGRPGRRERPRGFFPRGSPGRCEPPGWGPMRPPRGCRRRGVVVGTVTLCLAAGWALQSKCPAPGCRPPPSPSSSSSSRPSPPYHPPFIFLSSPSEPPPPPLLFLMLLSSPSSSSSPPLPPLFLHFNLLSFSSFFSSFSSPHPHPPFLLLFLLLLLSSSSSFSSPPPHPPLLLLLFLLSSSSSSPPLWPPL